MAKIVIVGAGFAGLNAAEELCNKKGLQVTIIDRRNHHLFQPLLYQVAMAGLSPADIAVPIRSHFSKCKNIEVIQGTVKDVRLTHNKIQTDYGEVEYDYLLLACGAWTSYFNHDDWEKNAPGLKTLSQATEMRRRVLSAFERAEKSHNREEQKNHLTFVIVGGGPTGVELAGAIGEMSRHTLARDFRNIDPKLTRIMLIEGGPRILPTFDEALSAQATRDLENLGVQVWTSSMVSNIDVEGVEVGNERINASTVLWAAGVRPSSLNKKLEVELDQRGLVIVEPDLSLKDFPNVFVAGDQANFSHQTGKPLPGLAPVALQQGKFVGQNILRDIKGKPRKEFKYIDKGQMATIGRSKAIVETGGFKFTGFFAWLTWLFVHIFYLTGFRNKLFVFLEWIWSYLNFRRGARLIVNKEWQAHEDLEIEKKAK